MGFDLWGAGGEGVQGEGEAAAGQRLVAAPHLGVRLLQKADPHHPLGVRVCVRVRVCVCAFVRAGARM